MICGRNAMARIEALAKFAAKSRNIVNRVTSDTAMSALIQLLVDRFLKEGRAINQRNVDRVLSKAAKIASSKLTTKTHLLPCHLMYVEEPDMMKIGPVTFYNRKTFRGLMVAQVKKYLKNLTTDKKHYRGILSDVLGYYRSFKWVGVVTIENCDSATSEKYALATVTTALDCIHLIFEAGYTDQMRVGGPRINNDMRGRLLISADNRLQVSWSRSVIGQVNFPVGWSHILNRSDMDHILKLAGTALESMTNPDLDRTLSQRFLDAAHWYGEAARETASAAKVVKYVTALERLLMTDERDDIASLVSHRASMFFAKLFDPAARAERVEIIKRLYDLRSRIVHGSMSPRAPEIIEGVGVAAILTSETALHVLDALQAEGLRSENVSSKRYAKWLGRVENRVLTGAPLQPP